MSPTCWRRQRAGPLVRKIHSPRRFDVAVNRAVARALGLVVADEQVLRERIADGGAQ